MVISRPFLLRMTNIWDKICRETRNTDFVFNNLFFLKSYSLWIMCENTVEPDRPQMTKQHMRIAWRPKSTTTHSECNTYCFPTARMVAGTHLHVTLYVPWLSPLVTVIIIVGTYSVLLLLLLWLFLLQYKTPSV